MTVRQIVSGCLIILMATGWAAAQTSQPTAVGQHGVGGDGSLEYYPPYGRDDSLDAAKKYVAKHSDRYLDHTKLVRGMKGYGLTVMAGMELVKFDVEIVSVMTRSGPHQDMILARLAGQGLETSGIIAGMSGSPCYIRDVDGKDKLIGAVAFGWAFQKEPICGIQPITQMLAVPGFLPQENPTSASSPTSMPASSAAPTAGKPTREYLATVLNPRKINFVAVDFDRRAVANEPKKTAAMPDARSSLRPLATPLVITGNKKAGEEMAARLGAWNFKPVQAGGVQADKVKPLENFKFAPGSAVSVALVRGDNDINAVGTVTDVVGDKLLIFGHAFGGSSPGGGTADGEVDFPMGPAYVHTIISGYQESFKMASALPPTGAVVRDEQVGVACAIGKKVEMIPVTVNVNWKNDNRRQTFNYEIIRHRMLTPVALRFCIRDATSGWHGLPEQHVVTHKIEIDFGSLGVYKAANVSTYDDISDASSDTIRPVIAFMRNPFSRPIPPKSVTVDVTIDQGNISAEILSLKLDGTSYKPGETVTGVATIRPFRQEPRTQPVTFKLPATLPEGPCEVSICDAASALSEMEAAMPQRFEPHSEAELFDALGRTVAPQNKDLYICLPLAKGGLAIGANELPMLPQSKIRIISDANLPYSQLFSEIQLSHAPTDYVLKGKASATIKVQRNIRETILRPQEPSK